MTHQPTFPFDNSYARLPEYFYSQVEPTPVELPSLIQFNDTLAADLGLDTQALTGQAAAHTFSGNTIPEGAEPLAMAYSGHQFGNLNPQLGDGRAILLGEVIGHDQHRYDIQLKGSGRTPYSRNGDGRAALGPVLREYLLSEAMANYGVPTTRALAAVTTGEQVMREGLPPGAIITRVASGFVRVGTFVYFAIRGNGKAVQELADYVIERNYPDIKHTENPYLALLDSVIDRQASLIAKWMALGFIHGVMNTDNMAISGETIDYGPCAFIDDYHPAKVFSSIDQRGRYAYQNQPAAGHWDLCRFAETLVPLIDDDKEAAVSKVQAAINRFPTLYEGYWLTNMAQKIGLPHAIESDKSLIDDLLSRMADNSADFTLTFYHLSQALADSTANDQPIRDLFVNSAHFDEWAEQWRDRLITEPQDDKTRQTAMLQVNPLYIPRNHLVEAVIRAGEDNGDFKPFYALMDVLKAPYTVQAGKDKYALPPEPTEVVHRTFCGT
ncbi:MAG: protein adenylyltransferase SelO [Leucothrix sp.]